MSTRRQRGFARDELRAAHAARFASQLAEALQEVRLTHKELARLLGVTHHTVDSWTRVADPMLPTDVNLERLATVLEGQQPGLGQRVVAAAGRAWPLGAGAPAGPGAAPAPLPAPESAPSGPTNLHPALTRFVGREAQIREVEQLLDQTRLLTLTGPGGVGKTRLALEVTRRALPRFAHGAWLVELDSLADPDLVPAAVAAVLGVREAPGRSFHEALAHYLRDRQTLLVLDNCEHVIAAAARLAEELLHACPRLRIMATSREALNCGGETIWAVPSLTIPYGGDTLPAGETALVQSEAGRLFMERAGAAQPRFAVTAENAADIAQICRQLDGIPLALELAAARVASLAPRQIAERLTGRFSLLAAGRRTALPRHQTLRACIEWSEDLLTDDERAVLRRLGVFQGGWTLEAAEEVCAGEEIDPDQVLLLLTQLVDKSLVIAEAHDGAMRYRLLETIRQYALERLDAAGEAEGTRTRHAAFFLRLAEAAESPSPLRVAHPDLLGYLSAELDNLRGAMSWSLDAGRSGASDQDPARPGAPGRNGPERVLRMALSLYAFWTQWGYHPEAQAWIERALARSDPAQRTVARAKALAVLAALYVQQGRRTRIEELLTESIALWRELVARAGTEPLPTGVGSLAFALVSWGTLLLRQGHVAQAHPYMAEGIALYRAAGVQWDLAMGLFVWADAALESDELAEVAARLEESLALYRTLGDSMMQTLPLTTLGRVAWLRGDYAAARARVEEALAIRRAVGAAWPLAGALNSLAEVLRCQDEYAQSAALSEESLALFRESGDEGGVAWALYNRGLVAHYQGQHAAAQPFLTESLALRRQHGNTPEIARCLAALGAVAHGLGQPDQAATLLGAADTVLATLRTPWSPADYARHVATVQAVHAALGEPAFSAAWARGQASLLSAAAPT